MTFDENSGLQTDGQFSPLSEKQYHLAFLLWRERYGNKDIDQALGELANLPTLPFSHRKKFSWIKKTREALLMSQEAVAKNLSLSRHAYTKMEKDAESGAVTLNSLALVAEAMDCELIVALRPQTKMSFGLHIWKKILPEALEDPWLLSRPESTKARALAAVAIKKFLEPDFRRRQKWVRNHF